MNEPASAHRSGLRIWPRTPAGRAALAVAVVCDAGLALDVFVLRPLAATPADPKPLIRTVLVAGIAGFALTRRRVEPLAPAPEALDTPAGWVARLVEAPGPAARRPLAAHLSADAFEVFWDGPPGPAPPPWQASPSGWVWEASPALLEPSGADPLPTLVPVGATATGTLWLNLGAFRLVTVGGDETATTSLVDAIVEDLARAAATEAVACVVVGEGFERGESLDLGGALALLWRRAARRPRRRRERRTRRRPPPDGPAPLVVVVPRAAPPDTVARLVDAGIGDAQVTLLVDGDAEHADLRLTCRGGRVEVSCLGDVTVAAPRSARPPAEPDLPTSPLPVRDEPPVAPTRTRVQVCVLGEVEVHGAPGPRAGKCLELVAYLACHPGGAPDHQIRAALWPDATPTAATWSNRVSVARKALGVDDAGEPYLRRFRRHVGQLAPTVGTDVAVIEAALDTSASARPEAAAEILAAALTAVRGRPFDLAFYAWASHEGHVERCERVVADATHRLVELALTADNPRRAVWAVAQGLRACPDSEVLRDDAARARAAARLAPPRPVPESPA